MARTGLFLPTTEIFSIQSLRTNKISNDQLKEILIRILQAFNESNSIVNNKDTGIYSLDEYVCSKTFFKDPALTSASAKTAEARGVLRKVINFGALPNAGTKNVAHGITIDANTQPNISFTRIEGIASDRTTPLYIPLPYVDVAGTVAAGDIELKVDGTNVIVTTTGDGTNFTDCYVILEYLID